jgi:hypothetical protein
MMSAALNLVILRAAAERARQNRHAASRRPGSDDAVTARRVPRRRSEFADRLAGVAATTCLDHEALVNTATEPIPQAKARG